MIDAQEHIPHDNLTEDGAADLARRLTAYWHAEGYPHVRFWIAAANLPTAISPKIWVVRTNLVGGLPPRRRRAA